MLSLLECIARFSLLSVDDINLGFIARCIFHSPYFSRSSLTSRKCGLTFSSYPFIDYFLSFSLTPTFHIPTIKVLCKPFLFIVRGYYLYLIQKALLGRRGRVCLISKKLCPLSVMKRQLVTLPFL